MAYEEYWAERFAMKADDGTRAEPERILASAGLVAEDFAHVGEEMLLAILRVLSGSEKLRKAWLNAQTISSWDRSTETPRPPNRTHQDSQLHTPCNDCIDTHTCDWQTLSEWRVVIGFKPIPEKYW